MESDTSASLEICAGQLVEVIPLVMRSIRTEMRSMRATDLSVPQLRALIYLSNNPSASLSDVAEHVGIGLPSMSKMIDTLVVRGLVNRQTSPTDRRFVMLAVTQAGTQSLEEARHCTRENLIGKLKGLTNEEQGVLIHAMSLLRQAFLID